MISQFTRRMDDQNGNRNYLTTEIVITGDVSNLNPNVLDQSPLVPELPFMLN